MIGIDEISVREGHEYRIVVSDLEKHRPIRFGGSDRSEASMDEFYRFLGEKCGHGYVEAVFRNSTTQNAPQAAILFDKFHILRHLGEALDKVRKHEFARLSGKARAFVKGQRYALPSHPQNLKGPARKNLKLLLAANRRLNTAYLLKESFGQLWDYNVSVRPCFQLPTFPVAKISTSSMSVRRARPRHITMLPGGGSFLRARYPPNCATFVR